MQVESRVKEQMDTLTYFYEKGTLWMVCKKKYELLC